MYIYIYDNTTLYMYIYLLHVHISTHHGSAHVGIRSYISFKWPSSRKKFPKTILGWCDIAGLTGISLDFCNDDLWCFALEQTTNQKRLIQKSMPVKNPRIHLVYFVWEKTTPTLLPFLLLVMRSFDPQATVVGKGPTPSPPVIEG